MQWVTWQNVGIDRMACAWLIRKYIDPNPTFTFIPYGEDVKETANSIPFDIPGVRLSHHRGRCTFVSMLKEYELKDPILQRIGKIIDGVDSISDIIPPNESEGIEAVCRGIRLLVASDHEAISQSEMVFNALYAYVKRQSKKIM